MTTKLSELCAYDELSEGQYRRFIDARGGCSCHLSPPCSACWEPATADELLAVGFEDFTDDSGDDINADMIRRDGEPQTFEQLVKQLTGTGCIFGTPRAEKCNLLTVAPISATGFSVWGCHD